MIIAILEGKVPEALWPTDKYHAAVRQAKQMAIGPHGVLEHKVIRMLKNKTSGGMCRAELDAP